MTCDAIFSLSKFLGLWNGVELYSHIDSQNETFSDTCLRLRISEVKDVSSIDYVYSISVISVPLFNYQIHAEFTKESDPYNYLLSLRTLKLKFSYLTHEFSYLATLNMTNIGFWKGDEVTVQVLRSTDDLLILTICDPDTPKLFTIVLQKGVKSDEMKQLIQTTKSIFQVRKLKIHENVNLQMNCTAELGAEAEEEATGKSSRLSFLSIFILFMTSFLLT